jgi:hypothetical protein
MTERERFESWLQKADLTAATEEWRSNQSTASLAESLMWTAWQQASALKGQELELIMKWVDECRQHLPNLRPKTLAHTTEPVKSFFAVRTNLTMISNQLQEALTRTEGT